MDLSSYWSPCWHCSNGWSFTTQQSKFCCSLSNFYLSSCWSQIVPIDGKREIHFLLRDLFSVQLVSYSYVHKGFSWSLTLIINATVPLLFKLAVADIYAFYVILFHHLSVYYVLFGIAIYDIFYPLLQLGVGPTIYPQRPGQIECDVSLH